MSLNVAIVGLGNIGNTHARVYDEHPETTIVAVCDAIEEKAKEGGERYKCRAFTSVKDMVEAGLDIDIASVATAGEENGGHHYEPTMALLEAGIVIVEGLDLQEIEAGPYELLCFPLKVHDGDGAPARVALRGPLG